MSLCKHYYSKNNERLKKNKKKHDFKETLKMLVILIAIKHLQMKKRVWYAIKLTKPILKCMSLVWLYFMVFQLL